MKQLGLAIHNYHDSHNAFPPGGIGPVHTANVGSFCIEGGSNNGYSWSVQILPYLDDAPRYNRFVPEGEIRSYGGALGFPDSNNEEWDRNNSSYQCPSDPVSLPSVNNSNYFAVQGGGLNSVCSATLGEFYDNGIFGVNSSVRMGDVTDGTSNVFMLGETKYALTLRGSRNHSYFSWASSVRLNGTSQAQPMVMAAARDQINSVPGSGGSRKNWPSNQDGRNVSSTLFGSFHPGGCHFTMADGSVHFVSENIDLNVYHTLAIREDDLPIGGFTP